MKLVLDASFALSWLFERQDLQEAKLSEKGLYSLADAEVWVPALWHIEIGNALLVGERRRVITEAQRLDYLHKLFELPIQTDETSFFMRRDAVYALALKHALTMYDAIYLDLALSQGAMLATFDKALAKAMGEAGGGLLESNTVTET